MYEQAELEFGKIGYLKSEKDDIIVYYKPFTRKDIRYKDITFCKRTHKVIFYEGTNFGPDAFKGDYLLMRAVLIQCRELGWHEDIR